MSNLSLCVIVVSQTITYSRCVNFHNFHIHFNSTKITTL